MTEKQMDELEKTARENLSLTPKQLAKFLKQARALRQNLALRKKQQQERKKCTHSK